jgi:hypothetical protein
MILTQLVRADILSRLTENQITILNSVLEAEIIQNASIRRTLTASVQPLAKGLSGAPAAKAAAARKK